MLKYLKWDPSFFLFPISQLLLFPSLPDFNIVAHSSFFILYNLDPNCTVPRWFTCHSVSRKLAWSSSFTRLCLYSGFCFLIAEWLWRCLLDLSLPGVFLCSGPDCTQHSSCSNNLYTVFTRSFILRCIFFHIFTSQKSGFILQTNGVSWCNWQCNLVEWTILEQPTTDDILNSVKCSTLCNLWGTVETA